LSTVATIIRKVVPKRFRPIGYLEHLVETRTGGRVKAGPFAGLRYIRGAVGSAYVPKLLGTYERELNDCLEEACGFGFSCIIDIGAAEGYYAVGLARRNPDARVIAFEMDPKGRKALEEMATLNEVGQQIAVRAKCGPGDLQAALPSGGKALVVCDVEGDEDVLLDPDQVPKLRRAHILVEMHDFIQRGITENMIERFAATHQVKRIWQQPRSRAEMPWRTVGTALLPGRYLDWAVSEWRPVQMSWLWMKPFPFQSER
jgi:hypothetical protein